MQPVTHGHVALPRSLVARISRVVAFVCPYVPVLCREIAMLCGLVPVVCLTITLIRGEPDRPSYHCNPPILASKACSRM